MIKSVLIVNLVIDLKISMLREEMEPMFPPQRFSGSKKTKSGKYSFAEDKRSEIFRFAYYEIRILTAVLHPAKNMLLCGIN